MSRLWKRVDVLSALFVAGAVALQFLPLSNVLGYEYALGLSSMLGVLGTLAVVRAERAVGSRGTVWGRAVWHAGRLLVWLVLALLLSLANAVRVPLCDVGTGITLWWWLSVGAVPVTVATGMVCEAARPGRGGWLVALVLGSSVVSGLAWLAFQPAIDVRHLWLGHVAASIYDEALAGSRVHMVYRVYTSVFAVAVIAGLSLHRHGRARDGWLFLVALGLALSLWAVRGDLGLERSRGWIERELGGRAELPGQVVYYDAEAFRGEELERMLMDHAARYSELERFWGVRPEGTIRSYVYADADQKGAMMGGRATMVAKIWLGEMHILWRVTGDGMLAHEMAHLFLREDGRGPLRLAMAGWVTPDMGLTEGAAVAAAWAGRDLDEHGWAAAMRRLDLAPDLESVMGATRFWRQPSANVYVLTGSFARWLIDEEGGAARFRRAYGRGDFESVYGESRASLIARWESWLDGFEIEEGLLEAARFRFDRSAIFGRVCGRAVATRLEVASAHARRGDADATERVLRRAMRNDPGDVRTVLRGIDLMRVLRRDAVAREWAEGLLEREGLGANARSQAQLHRLDLAWREGDLRVARDEARAMLESPLSPGLRREVLVRDRLLEEAEERPLSERAGRRLLADRGAPRLAAVSELAVASLRESSAPAAHLALVQLATRGEDWLVDELARRATALDVAEELRARALSSLALHHVLAGDRDRGCAIWAMLASELAMGSAALAEAELWSTRCAHGEVRPALETGTP